SLVFFLQFSQKLLIGIIQILQKQHREDKVLIVRSINCATECACCFPQRRLNILRSSLAHFSFPPPLIIFEANIDTKRSFSAIYLFKSCFRWRLSFQIAPTFCCSTIGIIGIVIPASFFTDTALIAAALPVTCSTWPRISFCSRRYPR